MQKSEKDSNLIKCVVVGDGTVGSTLSLIYNFKIIYNKQKYTISTKKPVY